MNRNPFRVSSDQECAPRVSPLQSEPLQRDERQNVFDSEVSSRLPPPVAAAQNYPLDFPSEAAVKGVQMRHRGSAEGSSLQQQRYAGMSGTEHSYSTRELSAFVQFVNSVLRDDPDLSDTIPISDENEDLFKVIRQGVLLPKLLNRLQPNLPKVFTKKNPNAFEIQEYHNATIQMAKDMNCSLVNIGPNDLKSGTPHLILGFIWQVLNRALLNNVTVERHPELLGIALNREGQGLSGYSEPEANLLSWFNHHLKQAGASRRVGDFSEDVRDGECYLYLLNQILPGKKALGVDNASIPSISPERRAELVCEIVDKRGLLRFIAPDDILSGNARMNLAFIAYIFNACPALPARLNSSGSRDESAMPSQMMMVMNSDGRQGSSSPSSYGGDDRSARVVPQPCNNNYRTIENQSFSNPANYCYSNEQQQQQQQQQFNNTQPYSPVMNNYSESSYSDYAPHPADATNHFQQQSPYPTEYYLPASNNYQFQVDRPPQLSPGWRPPVPMTDAQPMQQQYAATRTTAMWSHSPQQQYMQMSTMYPAAAPQLVHVPMPNVAFQPMVMSSAPPTFTNVIHSVGGGLAVPPQPQNIIVTTKTTYY